MRRADFPRARRCARRRMTPVAEAGRRMRKRCCLVFASFSTVETHFLIFKRTRSARFADGGKRHAACKTHSTEQTRRQQMRKLALTLSALGFVAFAGIANADQKTENIEKTDTGTTITGKHKATRTHKMENADGSGVETKTETVTPKNVDRADDRDTRAVRDDGNAQVTEKTEHHTTITGKKQVKSTKKVENADGSQTETTTTRTEPDKK
jgi:hypothetical protein